MNSRQNAELARQAFPPLWVRFFLIRRNLREAPIYQGLFQGLFIAILIKISEDWLVVEK
jgi:hypothetical protein